MSEQAVSIRVDGEVVLEGGISQPAGAAKGQALILHPHPLYGGSMRNNVVEALLRGALEARWGGLALQLPRSWRLQRGPRRRPGRAGGRGGGGGLAGPAAPRAPGAHGLLLWYTGRRGGGGAGAGFGRRVWVAPPLAMGELAPWPPDAGPLLLIAGDDDEFWRVEALGAYAAGLGARGRLLALEGVDHLFGGLESVLATETAAWLQVV